MYQHFLVWRDKGSAGNIGILGDDTSNPNYKVGDVIVYKNPFMGNVLTKTIICKDNLGCDYPMGLGAMSIQNLLNRTDVIKVLSYENLTDGVCKEVEECIKVEKVEVKKMTLEDIERELGYKIKIV